MTHAVVALIISLLVVTHDHWYEASLPREARDAIEEIANEARAPCWHVISILQKSRGCVGVTQR